MSFLLGLLPLVEPYIEELFRPSQANQPNAYEENTDNSSLNDSDYYDSTDELNPYGYYANG